MEEYNYQLGEENVSDELEFRDIELRNDTTRYDFSPHP